MARERRIDIILSAKDEASKIFDKISRNTLPALIKQIGTTVSAFASVYTIERFLQGAVTAAAEQEQADRRLAFALSTIGPAASATLPHLKSFAGALMDQTEFSDEAIEGVQQLLVQVGGLAGGPLDRATKATLDLSSAMGLDLNTAALLLAKAAQGSTTTLGRYGLVVDESIPKSEKFAAVLGLIEQKFGGTAQANVQTAIGSWKQLANAFNEFQEAIGNKGLPTIKDAEAGLTSILKNITTEIDTGHGLLGAIRLITGNITDLAVDAATLKIIAERTEEIAHQDDLDNPMIGFRDAAAAAAQRVQEAKEKAAALAEATRKAREEAAKAAERWKDLMQQVRETASLQIAPDLTNKLLKKSEQVKSPGTDAVIKGLADAAAANEEAVKQADALYDAYVKLQQPAKDLDEVWKRWSEVTKALAEAGVEVTPEIEALFQKLRAAVEEAHSFGAAMQQALGQGAKQAALELGDTMVNAAFGAKVSWSEAIRSILAGLAKAIIQAAILKALETIGLFAASGGGVAGSSGAASAGAYAASSGGVLGGFPVYAAGGIFTPKGTDVIPAMLTPGEIVIPQRDSREILGGRAAVVPKGFGGHAEVHFHIEGAMDGESVYRTLARNGQQLLQAIEDAEARRF